MLHAAQRGKLHQPTRCTARYHLRNPHAGVQLNNEFYFSYSLPLWCTLQRAFGPEAPDAPAAAAGSGCCGLEGAPFESDRVWNEYLTRWAAVVLGKLPSCFFPSMAKDYMQGI